MSQFIQNPSVQSGAALLCLIGFSATSWFSKRTGLFLGMFSHIHAWGPWLAFFSKDLSGIMPDVDQTNVSCWADLLNVTA